MSNTILIVVIVALGLLGLFIIPQWRLKRTIPQVIRLFKEQNAIGIKNAKMVDELGVRPRGMMDRMLKGRDYKQYALNALMKAEIIVMTEDGKFYLSEERLVKSGLDKNTPYYR